MGKKSQINFHYLGTLHHQALGYIINSIAKLFFRTFSIASSWFWKSLTFIGKKLNYCQTNEGNMVIVQLLHFQIINNATNFMTYVINILTTITFHMHHISTQWSLQLHYKPSPFPIVMDLSFYIPTFVAPKLYHQTTPFITNLIL